MSVLHKALQSISRQLHTEQKLNKHPIRMQRWKAGGADLVGAQKGVPVASVVHVLVSVQDESHRAAQYVGGHSSCSVMKNTARFLASKASSNALNMAHHLVLRDAQNMGDGLLMLGRSLYMQ